MALFNEKAEKLLSLSFAQAALDRSAGLEISWREGQPLDAQRIGPGDEAIDAFLLTFRFFVQDQDKISFRRMADVYASAPDYLTDRFSQVREFIKSFLDEPIMVQVDGKRITRGHLLGVFLWGGLSHANPEKKAIYDAWRARPLLLTFLQNDFVITLIEVCNCIAYVRALNAALLEADQESPAGLVTER